MIFRLTGSVLTRSTSCASFAWADLRKPQTDAVASAASFDALRVSVDGGETSSLLQSLLLAAPGFGLGYRMQCRIGHRPELPSRVRLHNGLFGLHGRNGSAKTIEVAVTGGQVVLVGVWVLADSLIDVAAKDCFDQSTCCHLVSALPLDQSSVLSSLADCLVTNGTSSINYPDLAERLCTSDAYLVRPHPQDREDVLLLGAVGSEPQMRLWVARTGREFSS